MTTLIGQSLGRYHILEQLGEGGMATVYKAYDTRLECDVAVKVIRTDQFAPAVLERILKRFEREAKAMSKLTHPNIVKVMDYGEHAGAPYLVMPYLPGGTLKGRLGKPMPWQEAVRLLIPMAQALEYAHEHDIVHRDIKPANILLTEKGQPMLTDFGIAKLLESEETATMTGTGLGVGTPEYMAPEQWTGQTTSQSDIYSLGVVFYEMVTGRKPYVADTPVAVLLKQASDPLPRPSSLALDLPEAVEKVLLKALAKKAEDRYQNMSEFCDSLENLLTGRANPEQSITTSRIGKSVTSDMDTQDTFLQEETNSTILQAATYDELSARSRVTPLPHSSAPPQQKKTVWWLLVGVGGLVCLVLIGFIGIGGRLAMATKVPEVTQPSLATQVPISNQIITTANAGKLIELSHYNFSELASRNGAKGNSFVIDWSPDGNEIAVLPFGFESFYIFDKTLTVYNQVNIGFEGVGIKYSPTGEILAISGYNDGKAYLIKKNGSVLSTLDTINTQPDVSFSTDGDVIVTGGYGTEIRFWRVNSGNLINSQNLGEDSEGALNVKFSPNGNYIATANRNGQVRLWDRSGDLIHIYDKRYVDDAEFNPLSTILAVAYVDGTVGLWDVNSGDLIEYINGDMEEVYNISWSPNGEVLAWCGHNGQITLWNIEQKKNLVKVGNSEWNNGLEFSPDGRFLLSSSLNNVQLWGIP